ncbi:Nitrite-sensitive transcriptional repressor NsrR [hydrothermal vent metagenome]|uniref:Nitrite-sensitive transcriptional repressor NsrR n=1 Tax=hydrothermal vent metagenome TaxID=652676 RepID=A0A3B0YZX4_9ZZZZ
MQITQFTDYSLRSLIYLGMHSERLCTISEIAEWHGISKAHLVKVVHYLTKLSYVKSTQGRGGGISLNMPASKINIGDLVRETEPNFNIAECFNSETNHCRITSKCVLKNLFNDATNSFLAVLDKHTLESILFTFK